jgi:hydroxymethylpyrimidine pyrophosphatase-like HAD family hydrolase
MGDSTSAVGLNPSIPSPDTDKFFSSYKWCINPILTMNDLLAHIDEEVDRLVGSSVPWQVEESKINLYLLASAISCTVDDFLSQPRWHIAPLAKSFAKLEPLIHLAEDLLNFPSRTRKLLKFRNLRKWKDEFDDFLEDVSRLLISKDHSLEKTLPSLSSNLKRLRSVMLPASLLNARMRLNEGYRCQDLTHHDVITLADLFLESNSDRKARYVVIGPRTAGGYFAPLLKVYFEKKGFTDISWATLRPRYGAHSHERQKLKRRLNSESRVIITDDYSNTGRTSKMLEAIVRSFGVPSEKIVMLAPIHPAKPEGRLSSEDQTKIFRIYHDDLYLTKLMTPKSMQPLLGELLSADDVESVSMVPDSEVENINRRLWAHYPYGFQVRLKRVYEVLIKRRNGSEERRRIFAKSVGLGWHGYHAYLAGTELSGFVPKVIGLRNGILFTEWLRGSPLTVEEKSDQNIDRMSSYLARRVKHLSLNEDPRSNPPFLGWGWLEILAMLRRVYNPLLGYLKHSAILARLKTVLHYPPTLVDGRMRPDEWIHTEDGIYKIDFEHHNFGAPELDVVDPAYDIAISSYEFSFTVAEENRMLLKYAQESGDNDTLAQRVFLYKLLYATAEAERNLHRILSDNKTMNKEELNERLLKSWNFRTYTMNRFCSELIKELGAENDNSGLVFMDIDGVFDSEIMGFPHTTINGLKAIATAKEAGYSVIPNTGRSCEHVRNYCLQYGFKGGIAEYGSAIVDASSGLEVPLVDERTLDEVSKCREAVRQLGGVFVDSGYRYSVRAYRYRPNGTSGLTLAEAKDFLHGSGLQRLKVITRGADTYFIGMDANKGRGIELYKFRAGFADTTTAAIGDSDEDIPMVSSVKFAYAPANCSAGIRGLAKDGKCIVLSGARQSGLLQAIHLLLHVNAARQIGDVFNHYNSDTLEYMMYQFLQIADYPLRRRLLLLLKKKSLE